MKKPNKKLTIAIVALLLGAGMSSCLKDKDDTFELPTPMTISGIPSDHSATVNPEIVDPNAIIPNYQFVEEDEENGLLVYRLDMTGIMNPETHEWLDLYGTGLSNQNVWMSLDNTPKGILVKNHSEDGTVSSKFDLVFLVDNSGSMSDESNALARDITDWANSLAANGLNIQFGCVGYGGNVGSQYDYLVNGYGITGALNLNNLSLLNEFLNERGMTGTGRTKGYWGPDATTLESISNADYHYAGGECSIQAARFANEHFSFRAGSNRVYVNFTDDANYPGGSADWSINYLTDSKAWDPSMGTIHTVYSGYTGYENRPLYKEQSWLISEYTGGTVLYADSYFSGVSLYDLPVTGALQHSYSIYFTIPKSMKGDDIYHDLKVTVLSTDHSVRAERNFSIKFE